VQDSVKAFKEKLTAPKFSLPDEKDPKTAAANSGPKDSTGASRAPGAAKRKPLPDKIVVDNVDGLKFGSLGLGVPRFPVIKTGRILSERESAGVVAGRINKQIDERTKAERDLAAKRGKPIGPVNVQISMENFDAYLDRIWPPSAIKTKIPSQFK
jgi:hypothetical protein